MFIINQMFSFDVTCLGLLEACGYAPFVSTGSCLYLLHPNASTQPNAPGATVLRAVPALNGKGSPFRHLLSVPL